MSVFLSYIKNPDVIKMRSGIALFSFYRFGFSYVTYVSSMAPFKESGPYAQGTKIVSPA